MVARKLFGKVMWVGRTAATVFGLALVLALVFGVATTAIGATGGNFILGKSNSATTVSKLTASIAGPALTLVNQSTNAAATALNISVASGKAPLKVNAAAGTATDLSADELDGMNSTAFVQGAGQLIDGRAAVASDSTSPIADVPGFGSLSVVRQLGAEGANDCRVVFRNESGAVLSRLGVRQGTNTSGVYSGIQSGVPNEDPSFVNGTEVELAGAEAQARGGYGSWQIVSSSMSKVLTVTVTANFGVAGQPGECVAAAQGLYSGQ